MFLFKFILLSYLSLGLTIKEAEILALKNSSSLKAEEMQIRALQSERNWRGKWQNPQITGQFGSLKSGPYSGATIEVALTQAIPITNKYALRKKITDLEIKSQELGAQYMKIWIKHQVALAVWRAYIANELYEHGKERSRRFGLIKQYLANRARISTKQKVEHSILTSQLILLEKTQDQKKHDAFLALNDLEYWLGRKVNIKEIKLKIPDHFYQPQNINLTPESDIELKKVQLNYEVLNLSSKLTKKESYPDLYLGLGYRREDVSPINHFSYGTVGLSLPLWDLGINKTKSAKARAQAEKEKYINQERKTLLKKKNLLEQVQMNIHQLERFPKKIINQSEKSIVEAERGFKQGLLDVNTFLQAETQSHEMIDEVFYSWLKYLQSLSEFQITNAEDLKWDTSI